MHVCILNASPEMVKFEKKMVKKFPKVLKLYPRSLQKSSHAKVFSTKGKEVFTQTWSVFIIVVFCCSITKRIIYHWLSEP